MARKTWMRITAAMMAISALRISNHRHKLIFAEHRHAERFRLLELRSRGLAGDDIRSFGGDRTGWLSAFALDQVMDLVARKTIQRAGDHDRLSGQRRSGGGRDELRSDAEALHVLDARAIGGHREIERDRLRNLRPDFGDLQQLFGGRVHELVDRMKVICQKLRGPFADHADADGIDEAMELGSLRALDVVDQFLRGLLSFSLELRHM